MGANFWVIQRLKKTGLFEYFWWFKYIKPIKIITSLSYVPYYYLHYIRPHKYKWQKPSSEALQLEAVQYGEIAIIFETKRTWIKISFLKLNRYETNILLKPTET